MSERADDLTRFNPNPNSNHNPNPNPHLNPQAKVPYSAQPPTTAATPNVKVANVAKQVSDVDNNDAANMSTSAQPTQSQRVPTLPTKNALLTQKKGITAFKRA